MIEPQMAGTPVRPRWWRWVLSILLLATVAGALVLPPFNRHRQGALKVIGVTSTAPGCGGIMYLDPQALSVQSGSTVQFTNRMDGMPIRFKVYRKGAAKPLAESGWLEPGETWAFDFWLPGEYTLSNNYVDYGFLAGLKGSISVVLF